MERGVPIRSITRCIAVLQVINRYGSLSLMDIAVGASLPYPTTCRIIQTLMHEGLIECEPTRKCYRATALVQTLSHGFHNHDRLVTKARPFITLLTSHVRWPVAIVTRVGQQMMVRDSTHNLTSLTFNLYSPGYVMPLLECASGHVYLAHASEEERRNIIEGLEVMDSRSKLLEMFKSGFALERIRDDGYATYEKNPHTPNPGKTSSISVPIFDHGHLSGTLTMAFFASTMPLAEALKRHLVDLKNSAAQISEALTATQADESIGRPSMPLRSTRRPTRKRPVEELATSV